MSGNKFIVGEYVEQRLQRTLFHAVGQVKAIYQHADETWTYSVLFGKGTSQSVRVVIAEADLQPYIRIHAHVSSQARDCDGTYLKDWTEVPTTAERTSEYGDMEFQNRVLVSVVSLHGHGTMDVNPDKVAWAETTEEGYRHVEAVWCEEEDCDRTSSQRDLTAEKAGY